MPVLYYNINYLSFEWNVTLTNPTIIHFDNYQYKMTYSRLLNDGITFKTSRIK